MNGGTSLRVGSRFGWAMVIGLLSALVLALVAAPPAAAQTAEWADWEPLQGSAGNYTTTMQVLAGGFPEATMTSDSRAGSVGVISGANAWQGVGTPPGDVYGSSQNRPYLNLRPRADNANAPSVTTYTFERPTPAAGWAFVLGDIDADEVTVSARGADGQPLTAAELGFEGGYNYCDTSPRPSTCSGSPPAGDPDFDVPTWNPGTLTLTGNAGALDTTGAAGWFQPTVPIKTLSFTFRWRSGFPVYQTWFASLAHDISGTVTGPAQCVEGATLNLIGPDGSTLDSTTPETDGSYTFPGYTAADGYEVEVIPPIECLPDGPQRQDVDLSAGDAEDVDFALREIIPVEVNGTVTDTDGNPIPGVEVTLEGTGGDLTATTDSNGFYVFDQVEPGDYTWSIVVPDGYEVETEPDPITVPEGSEEPITDNDFVLEPHASLSGLVTAGGSPVGGVLIEIDGPSGPMSTLTNSDGTYEFDRLPPGDYDVTVEPPGGYVVDGPDTQMVAIAAEDVTDVDFELARLGALGGAVTDADGNPLAGVTVEVTGPGGTTSLTTDDEGVYHLGDLEPGDYTVVIMVPDGATVDGPEMLSATITAAGERVLDLDFMLAPEEPDEPSEPGDPGEPADPDEPELPASGAGVMSAAGVGLLLVLAGAGAALVVRNRRQ